MAKKNLELDEKILNLIEKDKKEFYRCMKELEPSMNSAFYDDENS